MGPSGSHREAGDALAGERTEPLAAAGDPGCILPRQIARFGELAGRDLSARAFADHQPLTRGEQLEMLALRKAIACDHQRAAAGPADPGRPVPERLVRPVPLRRPSLPGPRRAPARHRRGAPESAQAGPEHRDGAWFARISPARQPP